MKKVVALFVLVAIAAAFIACGSQVQNGIDQFAEMLEKGGIQKTTKLLSKGVRESQYKNALKMFKDACKRQKLDFSSSDEQYFEKKVKPLYNL